MTRCRPGSPSQCQKGFSLIELMIVVAIMTALTSMVVPAVQNGIQPAVRRLKSKQPQAGVGNSSFGSAATLFTNDVTDEGDALLKQSNPHSTQSLTWAVVVNAANADPATGELDQEGLRALYANLLEREASLTGLIVRADALLARDDVPRDAREPLQQARDGLELALDGIRKIEAVIRSRATSGLPAP